MAEKQSKMDSVRKQWTEQRKGGDRSGVRAGGGSHFAKPVDPAPATDPLRTVKVPAPVVPVIPAPMSPQPAAVQQQPRQQRPVRISGVSGELPSVGMHVKRQKAIPYSRFNKRYVNRPEKLSVGMVAKSFSTEPVEGAPAYSWVPFLVYGLIGVLVTIGWCAAVKLTVGVPEAGGAELTVGLVWLCLMVAAGLALAAVTSSLTLRNLSGAVTIDVVASALGKTALAMLAIVVVWIGASALLTGIAL